MNIESVSLIGSGNIAHWMSYAMRKAGVTIRQVYSRQLNHAEALAALSDAEAIDSMQNLAPNSDLYLFAVKDDCYEELLSQLPFRLPLAAHTAGSLSMRIFEKFADNYGILYPFQSLNKTMNFEGVEVPLCVEANDKDTESELFAFAQKLSSLVRVLAESQRTVLHRAAVFGCNFTNAMYAIAHDMLQEQRIDWSLMLPLLQNTVDKVKTMNPHEAQTGPAQRGDMNIIRLQQKSLQNETYKEIYKLMTAYIMEYADVRK